MKHHFGLSVRQVVGITDIDDKIIARAKQLGESSGEIARRYERDFYDNMTSLNILPPDRYTRVTDHVPQIVDFIKTILSEGFGYTTSDGSVYFDTASFGSRYGKLQHGQEFSQESGLEKKSHRDFALWKAVKPGEPSWIGPGGNKGRPGWHIECSTMASSVFGPALDIHSGGVDLLFPHHNNEIAQCEACHSTEQWCNYFLHSGHLRIGQTKMSKSLGNYITIKDYLAQHTANQFRLFCLLSKYRSGIDYSDSSLKEAVSLEEKFTSFLANCRAYTQGQLTGGNITESDLLRELSHCQAAVQSHLADDFDTPAVVRKLVALMSFANRQLLSDAEFVGSRSPSSVAAVGGYLRSQLEILGLDFSPSDQDFERSSFDVIDAAVTFRSRIRQLAFVDMEGDLRNEVFAACDEVRDKLKTAADITIKDLASGSSWQRK